MQRAPDANADYCLTICTLSVVLNILVFGTILLFWNSPPRSANTDALAISITTIEVFLVVVALGGFWLLRRDVINTSKEEAEKILAKCEDSAEKTARAVAQRVVDADRFSDDDEDDIPDYSNAM
jgi:hypothetical protein